MENQFVKNTLDVGKRQIFLKPQSLEAALPEEWA